MFVSSKSVYLTVAHSFEPNRRFLESFYAFLLRCNMFVEGGALYRELYEIPNRGYQRRYG